MKILVTDRRSIERGLLLRRPYIVISIRDPDRRPVRLTKRPLCLAALELAFHDAEPVAGFKPTADITYMSEKDAVAIWQFVRQQMNHYEIIVVQCEQGMSRSPAVAAALARGIGLDEDNFWREYQPNHWVYELVVRARSAEKG